MTERFDLTETPLAGGITLLEASAGTGKTYAITALFVRLLLEEKVPSLREILVVTFTRDATAELRGRLREALRRAARVFAFPPGDPAVREDLEALGYLEALRERHPEGRAVLERALRQFDELAVFTIHGFCRRVLDQQAFESGLPFRVEFVDDEREFLLRAAWDFWRRNVPGAGLAAAACLVGERVSPDSLLDSYREYRRFRRPVFTPEPPAWTVAQAQLDAALTALRGARDSVLPALDNLCFTVKAWRNADETATRRRVRRWLEGDDGCVGAAIAFAQQVPFLRKRPAPTPAAVAAAAAFEPIAAAAANIGSSLRATFCTSIQAAFQREKERLGTLDQNDLLEHVRRQLAGEDGAAFAQAVQQRYRVALVDEFQDTDPVQWDIFSTLFGDQGEASTRALYMIGDPKQAIYSFRGADIYAYLAARERAARRFSLSHNWRSHPDLIDALNALWGRLEDPFLHRSIAYERVEAGRTDLPELTVNGGNDGPIELWMPTPGAIAQVEHTLQHRIAAECLHLLDHGRIGDRAVQPEDIAILVRANRDAEPIQARLREAGIPSVIGKAGELAQTREARELAILLLAVAQAGSTERIRAAMGTALVGCDAAELQAHSDGPAGAESDGVPAALPDLLAPARRKWSALGATPALEWLLRQLRVRDQLLAGADGLRRTTNLEQLLDWVHRRAQEGDDSPEAIARWFQRTLAAPDLDEEQREMRPEAHGGAVRILTIHRAKGLEYPIVFAPFLYRTAPSPRSEEFSIHDDGGRVQFVTDRDEAKLHRRRDQELGEAMRLAYVACTRAVHRLYTVLPMSTRDPAAAAYWLWLGPQKQPRSLDASPHAGDVEAWKAGMKQRLGSLDPADLSGDGVRATALEPVAGGTPLARWSGHAPPRWATARPAPTVPRPWSIESFSSLTRGRGGGAEPFAEPPARTDVDTGEGAGAGILGFARGARAGNCLHAILERIDLTQVNAERTGSIVRHALRAHGLADAGAHPRCPDPAATVLDMLSELAATPWPGGGGQTFGDVTPRDRLDEWAFHLPLPTLRPRSLRRLFAESDDEAERRYAHHLHQLGHVPVEGFLTGSIDMVAHVNGRYWVVDWKSNYLGPTASDYGGRELTESMHAHHYALQGQLYLAALRAYLRQRLGRELGPDAIGGMIYVYLRGLDGRGGGLWTHTPSASLSAALDRSLADGEEPAGRTAGGTP